MANSKKLKKQNKPKQLPTHVEKKREQERAAAKKAKRRRIWKRIGIAAGPVVLTGGIVWGVFTAVQKSGILLHNRIAMSSEHYEVNNAMMDYYYVELEKSFFASGQDYLNYVGVDPEKSLKEQIYQGDTTWFDYLMQTVTSNNEQMLVLLEEATAQGMTLDDTEKADMEQKLSGINLEDYAPGVRMEDVRKAVEYSLIATKYSNKILADTKTSEADWEAYYAEHEDDYLQLDALSYAFTISDEGMTAEESMEQAKLLEQTTSRETFEKWVEQYLTDTGVEEDVVNQKVEACKTTGALSNFGEEITAWAKADTTQPGDTYIAQSDTACKVYMLLSKPVRDEQPTVDIRHILLSTEKCGSAEAALERAKAVLEEWKKGAANEESFGELAKQYSADGSASSGGLYEKVYPGEMVEEFDAWCFDESRRDGDTDIVETQYGAHVMYFVKHSLPRWQAEISGKLDNEGYQNTYKALVEQHPVTKNEKNIAKVADER